MRTQRWEVWAGHGNPEETVRCRRSIRLLYRSIACLLLVFSLFVSLKITSADTLAAGGSKYVLDTYVVKYSWGERSYALSYNKKGLVCKIVIVSHSDLGMPDTVETRTFTYASNGNLKEMTSKIPSASTDRYLISYKGGRPAKMVGKVNMGTPEVTTCRWNGNLCIARAKDSDEFWATIKVTYDSKGRPTARSIRNDGEKEEMKWTYQYDRKGCLKNVGGNAYKETFKNTYRGSLLTESAIMKGPVRSSAVFSYKKVSVPKAYTGKVKNQQKYLLINWTDIFEFPDFVM